jgi:hypothetical protein
MFASKDILLAAPSGYKISRSVRLRNNATAYFNRTPASAGNRTTWTWSAWVKRGTLSTISNALFGCGVNNTNDTICYFGPGGTGDVLDIVVRDTSIIRGRLTTTPIYRDPSAWYHFVVTWDSSNATSADRFRLYVNGIRVTAFSTETQPPQNTQSLWNSTQLSYIGRFRDDGAVSTFDGHMTEVNFIDGQALTPSAFGEINPVTGVWQPKQYTGTYGTNGFELNFSDNSAATAAAIGKDYSGNGNNWTPNNISVTAGATYDSMLDVPTPYADGGNGRGNYATLNPLDTVTALQASLASGNLELNANTTSGASGNSRATIAVNSGKWYFEATLSGYVGSSNLRAGWDTAVAGVGTGSSGITGAYKEISSNQTVIIAVDFDNLLAWVGSNGTWDAGNPSAGTGGTSISLSGYLAVPFVRDNSGTAGNGGKWTVNFGQRPFSYTPPTGFLSLNTQNLPASTISNGAAYMAATAYSGTGANQVISNAVNGVSFQPDFVWMKKRSASESHILQNSISGVTKFLISNSTAIEDTSSALIQSFDVGGFTAGTSSTINGASTTYVGWQWNAGGSTVTNTSGSISAQVRANPTAGFSVVTFTGTGAAATVGHGLGVAPDMVIIKSRSLAGENWIVYHISLGNALQLNLNTTAAQAASTNFNSTSPTSSVFSIGSGTAVNSNTNTYVAYCFDAVAGYSKFGSYTGNGSTDGPFVFLGFRPRFIMVKRTDATGNWVIIDTSRLTYNPDSAALFSNLSNAEGNYSAGFDILSNGFKLREPTNNDINLSGGTYIYAAFAENPFKNSLAR